MPSYRALPEARLVLFRPQGSLDPLDLKALIEPCSYERGHSQRWDRLLDLSRVKHFALDYAGLSDLSSTLEPGDRSGEDLQPIFRMAILCSDSYAFGMARMMASVLDRNGIETRVFRDLQVLGDWLGLSPKLLMGEQGA